MEGKKRVGGRSDRGKGGEGEDFKVLKLPAAQRGKCWDKKGGKGKGIRGNQAGKG